MTPEQLSQIKQVVEAGGMIPPSDARLMIDEIERLWTKYPSLDFSQSHLTWKMGSAFEKRDSCL